MSSRFHCPRCAPALSVAAAPSIAARMRRYVPHRHRLPLIAAFTSARVGIPLPDSRLTADMIWPDWQYPHCGTLCLIQAARTASAAAPDTPSMVATSSPAAAETGIKHDRVGRPSRCTRATQSHAASELSAFQLQRVSDHPKQRRTGIQIRQFMFSTIHRYFHLHDLRRPDGHPNSSAGVRLRFSLLNCSSAGRCRGALRRDECAPVEGAHQLKSNKTLPPRSACSIASFIWDGLYVAVNGKVNFPDVTTLVASVSAARILGRYSSKYIQKPWIFYLFPMRSPCGT